MLCPKCGFDNPASFAFCGRCGSPISSNAAGEATEGRSSPHAERRQITVMFCDMVGSTALSGQLDPEELNEVTREYQSVCAKIIEHHGGRIAQFLGDGLMVYFGYPVAHEDDAQRAVRAGLEIVTAVAAEHERGRPLQVRIAIHTGLAVVGQLGGETNPDPMAISGETPNIAARLQSITEPDTVVISHATYRLVEGFFRCRNLGTPALKGVVSPLQAYSVIEETGIRTRFEKAVASGLTALVGREKDVELLLHRWQQAVGGKGQVVVLSGEGGIGKSRLVQVLKDCTTNESITELNWRCSPYYRNSAIYPAIDLFQRILHFNRSEDSELKLAKLEEALGRLGFALPDTVPLFAALLSLPPSDRYPAPTQSPRRQKQKTLEAIVEWLSRIAERGPARLIVEDLHWADPSTLELIDLLIERVPDARLFVALVSRPEFVPPWPALPHVTNLTLERLSPASTELMLQSVARGKQLPTEVVSQIVAKTEGIPLFVEELTRMVLESELLREQNGHYVLTSPLPALAIPSTLYDSLMVRLDRLGSAKEVAQLCATIGREFSYELLRAVAPLDETELTDALNRLVDAELLEQKVSQPGLRYSFRHALIRDAAYESLLRRRRRHYHRRIAEVMRERFADNVEARPELLASHFTEAGLIDQAIPYWQKAGQRAFERSANTEAIRLFALALDLLKKLPQSAQRDAQELELFLGYLPALNVSRNWSSAETGAAYERARELCERLGETSRMFRILLGQSVFYFGRGEQRRAHDIALQVHDLAGRSDKRDLRSRAGWLLGVTLYFQGGLVAAHDQLIEARRLSEDENRGSEGRQNQRIDILSNDAEVMWMLGYPDQSKKIGSEALALARRSRRPFELALALTHAHMLSFFRRDYAEAIGFADQGMELCVSKNFDFLETALAWSRDNARIFMGVEHDINVARREFTAYHEVGTKLHLPANYTFLAQCFGILGRPDLGLDSIEAAIPAIETTGQRNWEAETWRVKGDSIMQQAAARPLPLTEGQAEVEAEGCIRKAIDIARRQQSKLFELRATMSLARLLKHSSRFAEALASLAEVYNWFTEGFDSVDLKQARALLEELSSTGEQPHAR
jgi:class 3 adenylate cyclase/tetratricopeptide (TPR) repeat protein